MIDKENIQPPHISLTPEAENQLNLMLLNDHTLEGKKFRIQISGKGCDGFTYSAGFTPIHKEDLLVEVSGIEILIDSFSAFYLKEVVVDYIFDFDNGKEGFVISNMNQESYTGKFWREDPSKIPPLVKNQ